MITAEQARKLTPRSLESKLEILSATIERLAKMGQRSCRTGWEHKEDLDLWVNGGYSKTEEWARAKAILEEYGYKVDFFYEEKQFVNMYTIIEW